MKLLTKVYGFINGIIDLMNFKEKAPYIFITIILFFGLSYYFSQNIFFSGDEFYTLDIEKINKPIPYQLFVKWYLNIFSIGPSSVFLIRVSSIIFSIIGIVVFLYFVPSNKNEIQVASILILSNSFLLRETIFFRYYSFYFLTSVIILILLLFGFKKIPKYWQIFFSIMGALISPFLFYVLNALQFGFYFLYTVLFENILSKHIRILISSIISISIPIIIINPQILWKLMSIINLSGHANVSLDSLETRGFSFSILIKPFYAVYQMIFGYYVAPTGSIISIIGFSIICIGILYLLWIFYKKNGSKALLKIVFSFILPFIMIYYFFEPLSLPGFTQLEPKHGMLLFPFLIYIISSSVRLLPKKMFIPFLLAVFISQLTGMYYTLEKKHPDWNKIVKLINDNTNNTESHIIMDGRSQEIYNFYNREEKCEVSISYSWEDLDKIKENSMGKKQIALLLNDYKSFTPLTLKQNWNAGRGSIDRVEKLNSILLWLNSEYRLIESYINYPTFLYLLERKEKQNNIKSFGVWEHHLKDLILPAETLSGTKLYSSLFIQPGDSILINSNSVLILNLENSKYIKDGQSVGSILIDGNAIQLIKGENIWDIFSDYYDEPIDENKIMHTWHHKPLVSGSIKYDGSYFKHKACIYSLNIQPRNVSGVKIVNISKNAKIRVWN